MSIPLFLRIAVRYLRGRGPANAVPILSRISILAIAVSSCAMIILFSVFNGFGRLIDDLYKAFYPDIKVTTVKGKFFEPSAQQFQKIQALKGVSAISAVIEDNVLVNTEEGDYLPASIKGVDAQYFRVNDIQSFISKGNDTLIADPHLSNVILGEAIAAQLGLDVDNVFARIMVFSPNSQVTPASMSNPAEAFRSMVFKPDGTFAVQEDLDSKYMLAPLSTVQELLAQGNKITSLEIKLKEGSASEDIKEQVRFIMGSEYSVATRYEQNKAVYMVIRTEKWAGYLILLFVLLIASFNMVSALSLLVLEKKKDMGILQTMGLLPQELGKIFLAEGALWGLSGGLLGVSFGLLLCGLQIWFGLVKIQGAFIVDNYPVAVVWTDVAIVLITVVCVGLLAAILPANKAVNSMSQNILGTRE